MDFRKPKHIAKGFSKPLLQWFQQNARDLPWRKNRSPYRVWLAEIMLQQTRVETVIPYYERFLQRWPEIADLSQASLDQVLKEWEGLGYYSRARNLHRAAHMVVHDFEEKFPATYDEIRSLPGIGAYSAGAILSLAFNQKFVAMDGNIYRVFSRLLARNFDASSRPARAELETEILRLTPDSMPGCFNEALMELGALICLPRNPHCPECPVKKFCTAYHLKQTEQFPLRKRPPKVRKQSVVVAVIQDATKVLLCKNPERKLLGGLWSFPTFEIEGDSTKDQRQKFIRQSIKKKIHLSLQKTTSLSPFRHQFTHIDMTLHPYLCEISKTAKINSSQNAPLEWVPIQNLEDWALPKAHRKIAQMISALHP